MGEDEARRLLAPWVERFSLGFHPDTRGRDYVYAGGARCLTDAEAAQYDADIEASFGLCDPYELSLDMWREAGLLNEGE